MQEFKSIKQVLKEEIKSSAKDLAWKSLSKEERKEFTTQAKAKQTKRWKSLAIKCVKEADEAMSKPDYVSHLDSAAYGIKDNDYE
jgi:hypothetical protein